MRPCLAAAIAAAALAVVAGCAGPAGKSGGAGGVVLDLAVADDPGSPAARIAESFAGRVEQLSNGSIRVAVTYWPARFEDTAPTRQVDASAVRALRADEAQLGVVPAEALAAQGARGFAALQAPFLIATPREAVQATGGAVAARLEAAVTPLGLTGLALVPAGLNRPFGYLKPLESPADFAGLTIRARAAEVTYRALAALGARPVDLNTEQVVSAVRAGFVTGAESLGPARDAFPADTFTAANVVLSPEVEALVVSTRGFGRLDRRQRHILRRAAADTRATTIAADGEQAAAAAYCRAGGSVVVAPPPALRALRATAAPVLAALRRDPATGAIVAAIERTGGGASALRPCGPSTASTAGALVFDDVKQAERIRLLPPTGAYRRVVTAAELRAAGAEPAVAESNQGVTTLSFTGLAAYDGVFAELAWRSPAGRPPCRGRVGTLGARVAVRWNPATPCTGMVGFTWRLDGRDLVIVGFDPRTRPAWLRRAYLGRWERVDCTPLDVPGTDVGARVC